MKAAPEWPADRVVRKPVGELVPYAKNARLHNDAQIAEIARSIGHFGFAMPILIDEKAEIIAGHGRLLAAEQLGLDEVPCMVAAGWTDKQIKAYRIADNQLALNAAWDVRLLTAELGDLPGMESLVGFREGQLEALLRADEERPLPSAEEAGITLAQRFGLPPFSVLNAREGWWQERKRAWLALGIQSELGRGENPLHFSDTINRMERTSARKANGKTAARTFGQDLMRGEHTVETANLKNGLTYGTTANPYQAKNRALALHTQDWGQGQDRAAGDIEGGMAAGHSGTSIFDPVLCELAYRWFCPPGGTVLDPFAGGSVRGIVASRLDRPYVGIDLSARQIEANRDQAMQICKKPLPQWHVGDSRAIGELAADTEADLIFSCPPYADLEIYSDDPADLSRLPYDEFRAALAQIIEGACALLKPDRFACFVVGEVRGKGGAYYGFVPDTIDAFRAAGLKFYNEAILVTAAGSLPIRAARQFETTRKLGKTHQNVLVFVKGDGRKATAAVGPVEFAAIDENAPE